MYFGEKAEMKAMWTIRENQQEGERIMNSWCKPYILFSKGTAQRNTSYLYKRQFHPLSSKKCTSGAQHFLYSAQGSKCSARGVFRVNDCQGTSYMGTQNKNTCNVHFWKQTCFWETRLDARSTLTTAVYQGDLLEALGELKEKATPELLHWM